MQVFPVLAAAMILQPAASPATPSCEAALDELASAHEANYAGYSLEIAVSPERLQDYRTRLAALAARARGADGAECFEILLSYIGVYKDPHLFVSEAPRFSAEQVTAYAAGMETYSPHQVDAVLASLPRDADPILGRWFEAGRDYAIIPGARRNEFLAVEMTEGDAEHPPGRVVARFEQAGDHYRAVAYRPDGTPRRHIARIHRNVILFMSPMLWGRRGEEGRVNAADPSGPAFTILNGQAALLSLPTFFPNHQQSLEQLLEANRAAIQARELLIVDLRGNVGGSSTFIAALAPYYYAESSEPPSRSWADAYVLASPLHIAEQERIRDRQEPGPFKDFMADLVARMRAAPGQLIPYAASEEMKRELAERQALAFFETSPPPRVYTRPRHIAFLVDEHTISAPEAALLSVRRSPKVTLFGRNTAGATDYQNVRGFTVGSGEYRYLYALPTIVATNRLPEEGFRLTGVPVDVPIDLDRIDPVEAILRHYRLD